MAHRFLSHRRWYRSALVLAFIDYGTKTVATGDCFVPSGDIDRDFRRIRSFYAQMRGRHPHRFALPLPQLDSD